MPEAGWIMAKLAEIKAIAPAVKMNCWEFKKCGRQLGGSKVPELGVCPAAVEPSLHHTHGGTNAGRACWVVAGSLCGGKIQGTYAKKLLNCWRCEFMNLVKQEEEPGSYGFSHTRLGMERTLLKERGQLSGGTVHPAAAATAAAARERQR